MTSQLVERPFRLDDEFARQLAAEFGTPLYVLSEADIRARAEHYLHAHQSAWPGGRLSYASKANSAFAVLRLMHSLGFDIDVASEGELRAAMAAGIPAERCHMHGNAKTPADRAAAVEAGVGVVIVDNLDELKAWAETAGAPELWLRVAPGVDPITHEKTRTGQSDSKFGFSIVDGQAENALRFAMENSLNVTGVHAHVGSQLYEPTAQRVGGLLVAQFAREMYDRHGWRVQHINVGGGRAARYRPTDTLMPLDEYCQAVSRAVRHELGDIADGVTLHQEPGRSILGESGVTLYHVIATKRNGVLDFVIVDGGLSDNPRPGLYNGVNPVRIVGREGETYPALVAGKHCETDHLFEHPVPKGTQAGDLMEVGITGAYNASMASNYNRYPFAAMVMVRTDGNPVLVQRRQSWEDMFSREVMP